jgi:uncharacterized protein YndB with AHSA1/START domain
VALTYGAPHKPEQRRLAMMRGSRRSVVLALLALAGSAAPAAAQEVENTSYVAPDGSRVLQHRIVIPATLAQAWDAFTTSEGLRAWAVPFAHVDFRLGGLWESSYRLDATAGDSANIHNRYISFLPMKMVSVQAVQAPPGFPHPELLPELFTVIEFEELSPGRVRVTTSGVGYRHGPDYDVLHRHFDAGNAWSLEQLYKRFAEGPVDWPKVLSGN